MPTLSHSDTHRAKSTFAHVVGAFRLLGRRAEAVGRPGLRTWSQAGERAALQVRADLRDSAHRAEVGAQSLADDLRAMMADGEIDRDELRRLRLAPERARRIADECHHVGEVAS